MFSMFSWLANFWSWLTSPAVIPLAGAFAAVLVAFTVETKTWVRRPISGFLRGLRVAALWLLLAWLMGGFGGGGFGGEGSAGESSGDGNVASGNGHAEPRANVQVVAEATAPQGSQAPKIVIRFVESVVNPAMAQEFACDVIAVIDGQSQRIKIRAANLGQLESELRRQLLAIDHSDSAAPTVQIDQTPFPGDNVIRGIQAIVGETMPGAAITVSPGP